MPPGGHPGIADKNAWWACVHSLVVLLSRGSNLTRGCLDLRFYFSLWATPRPKPQQHHYWASLRMTTLHLLDVFASNQALPFASFGSCHVYCMHVMSRHVSRAAPPSWEQGVTQRYMVKFCRIPSACNCRVLDNTPYITWYCYAVFESKHIQLDRVSRSCSISYCFRFINPTRRSQNFHHYYD